MNARAKLLAMPFTLAPKRVGLESPAKAIVETEIHGVLNELADIDLTSPEPFGSH
jgi:hypothetical protein